MAMIRLPMGFRAFLKSFNNAKVDYMVVGGYAVNMHGYVRNTGDLDVWIKSDLPNAQRVVDALVSFGFAPEDIDESLFIGPRQIVRMGVEPEKIEIITTIEGVDWEDCKTKSVSFEIDGLDLPVIGLADLRKNKAQAGRHRDLDDLENLPEVE
ncbi:hypothetical protein OT109_06435 [Phycisphaeraceae bacterium D3-23]